MKTLKYIFILVLLPMVIGCRSTPNEAEAPEAEEAETGKEEVVFTGAQFKTAGIEVGAPADKQLSVTIRANGVLDVPPYSIASIHAPLGGFVKKSELLPGTFVAEGEVLAVLENPEYIKLQQGYLETRNEVEFTRKEYERQKTLMEGEVSAAQKLERAESAYNAARVQLAGLEAQLRLIGVTPQQVVSKGITSIVTIKAPFKGYITEVNVNQGKYVSPNEVMYELINKEHLHVELQVFEKDIFKVKEGQKIAFHLPNAGNEEFAAKVHLISQTFNNETKTIGVHGHLDQEYPQFKPGMFVEARIFVDNVPAEVVPDDAIMEKGGRFYCFSAEKAADKWVFRQVEVSKGVSQEGYTAITLVNPPPATLQLVLKGSYYIIAEMNKGAGEEE